MSVIATISRQLPVLHTREVLVNDGDQNVDEIIEAIKDNHREETGTYDTFAHNFWAGNAHDTASKLFRELKDNIHYSIETEKDQTVKTPGRLVVDGRGDCKHYASYIVGVADALARQGKDIKGCYRFVSDEPGREIHHVFAVIRDSKGNEYWVDPVISTFNKRPHFYNIKDVNMAISKLSGTQTDYARNFTPSVGIVAGINLMDSASMVDFMAATGADPRAFANLEDIQTYIIVTAHKKPRALFDALTRGGIAGTYDDAQVAGFFEDLGKGIKNTFDKVTTTVKKAVEDTGKGIKNFASGQQTNLRNLGKEVKKFGKGQETNLRNLGKGIEHAANEVKEVALKVGLSAGRGPALAIISMNAFNWGKRVYDTLKSSPQNRAALLRKWNDIGGSPTALVNAANSGARKYFGSKWDTAMKVSGVGELSVAALMALAAGVLAIIEKFIKSGTNKNDPEVALAIKEGAAQLAVNAGAVESGAIPLPGYSDSYLNMQSGVYPDGTPYMNIPSASYPDLAHFQQMPEGYSSIDVPGGGVLPPDSFDGIISHAFDFARKHKLLVGVVSGVVGMQLVGSVLPKKHKKWSILAGIAMGGGTVLYVEKARN
jgi:hypothetical protein